MGLFGEKSALLVADMIFDFVDPAGKLYVRRLRDRYWQGRERRI